MATKRIAVLGGPRCGKTTLIQHLYTSGARKDDLYLYLNNMEST